MKELDTDANPLDSKGELYYPVGEADETEPEIGHGEERQGGETMIVFLSFPRWSARYQSVVTELERRGLIVLTNFDRSKLTGAERKTDLRLARIRRSNVYVYFAETNENWVSTVREAEFGYALGCGLSVAYVGSPLNSLHRYGDVFDDVEDFIEYWYSNEYIDRISELVPDWSFPAIPAAVA